MKYGTWKISSYEPADARALCAAGFSPITAALLCSRGYRDAGAAREFLSCSYPLSSPFALLDMDKAAARVKQALSRREHIAVFGDYDVDGITATCLLTEYLRSKGGHVTSYIPARLEEGYGLNPIAIDTLKKQGVELIVTVDCGITANQEAQLCKELGIDLVITDHHECKSELPQAAALVDPHRKDQPQPVTEMAGVGVAFKLAAAIDKNVEVVEFQGQSRDALVRWLQKRFRALDHQIDLTTADYMLFYCGTMMDNLISEVSKVAAYAKAQQITTADIDAVAEPVLDARIFDMTNHISARDYNKAAAVLGDLLRMQTEPIVILGAIGKELRRLYTARMAIDAGKDRFWLMELWQMRSDYPAKLLLQAARNVDHEWCKRSLTACQVLDRRMKSEKNIDREGELTKFVLELAQK